MRALSNAAAYAETQSGENVQSAGEDNTSISEGKRTNSIIGLTAQNKSADRNYLSSKEMNTTNDVSISDNNSIFGYDENVNSKDMQISENDTRQFSISEGDTEIIPRYGLIDKYSEGGYNRNGWAYVNGILYGRATAVFLSKVASIKTGVKFVRSADGDYIIPTGHEDGINNILVYTDGNILNPSIDRIVKINLDNETNIELIRGELFAKYIPPMIAQIIGPSQSKEETAEEIYQLIKDCKTEAEAMEILKQAYPEVTVQKETQ